MLPIRLKVYNFLPYRDPEPLLFDGIQLACLTGSNGAGKSSVLDAVTWVLWGEARAKTAFDLVHLGQSDMYVELDYHHQGAIYRVVRKLGGTSSKPKSALDLLSIDTDGMLTSLNGTNLRETQRKISDMLHMDHKTFVSSAYLQQGKADAFTVMQPADRKKLLSDILGIEQWSVYEDRAKEARKANETQLTAIQGRLQEIEVEISREFGVRTQLTLAQEAFVTAEARLKHTQERLATVQNAESILRDGLAQLDQNKRHISERENDIHEQQSKSQQCRDSIAQLQATLAEETTITEGYAQLLDVQQKNEQLNEQLSAIRPLEQRQNALIADISKECAKLERELASVDSSIHELTQQQGIDHSVRLQELAENIAQLNDAEKERTQLQADIKSITGHRGELQATQKQLERDGKERSARIETLKVMTDATCPTCGQAMTPEHRDEMVYVWNEELESHRSSYRDAQQKTLDINATLKDNETRLSKISEALAKLPYLKQEEGKLQQAKDSSDKAQKKMLDMSAKQQTLQTQLTTNDYCHAQRADLAKVEAQLQHITYNSADHEALKRAMQELRDYENSNRALDNAKKLLPKEQEILAGVEERLKRLSHDLNTLQNDTATLEATLPVYEANLKEYRELNTQMKRDNGDFVNASNNVSNLKQELSAIEAKKERRIVLEAERDAKTVLSAQYKELIAAFGKNGVPAMIIESAIPELEVTANDLLNRMSAGRMHLRLTTQTANQDGTLRETLDIEIADELGTRSYEMYSGGEAFRINFALRIALSKMLARRAGAHLQTLFIDEGFGTQDEDGRAKLVEAINTVQHEFDMILVITHMEDLRDSFPVHIVVEKTPRGSVWGLR